MTIDLTRLTANTQSWAQNTSTASVSVTLDGAARTLTGTAAAAYLFGQALTTVKFGYDANGLQLTDGRFEFPPASGQWVSLAEVADALRYKYGVDPLIEFAPGLGARGYSVADINRILELLNREFADSFNIALTVSSTAVKVVTQASATSPASFTVAVTATDTAADSITFINDPGWTTGMAVRVSTAGGGLDAGTDYFVRNLTGGQYALFTTQADALGAVVTGRVPLTANISTTVSPSPAIATTVTDTDTTNDTLTFFNDPGWATGLPVRVTTTGGGLTAGTDYFVRNLTGGEYAFYTDQAAAVTGTTGRVPLTADISTTVSPRPGVIGGNATDTVNDTVTFLSDPGWITGTLVKPSTSGGGLTAGQDYFVRNLTGGKYAFFSSQNAAAGSGSGGRAVLFGDVSATFASPSVGITGRLTGLSDEYLSTNRDLVTGQRVRMSDGNGPVSGVDYFVRESGSYSVGLYTFSKYQLYTSQAEAIAGGVAGRVNLSSFSYDTFIPQPPSATVENDWVSFSSNPNWASGTRVRVDVTGGGLTAGEDYFVRSLGSGRYEFFTSQAVAMGTGATGRVELTREGIISSMILPYPPSATVDGDWATFSANRIWSAADDDWITLPTDPTWPTGTLVRASTTGGGLTAGVDYFVRDLTGGKYAFFTTQAAASGAGTAGRVSLTTGASITLSPSLPSASVDDDWVSFASDPTWATGTPVRVNTDGGGLTAGVDYFVRSLGSGRYDFFTSQAAAAGASNAGRVNLTGSIGTVSPSYSDAALSAVLDATSAPILAAATESELRQNLTAGGDLYTDRFGAFYLNGVRTQAMDVAVTSRLLVQDNVSAEYKTLMDELAERNNMIAMARTVIGAGRLNAVTTIDTLRQQYGMEDVLGELTAGQFSDDNLALVPVETVGPNGTNSENYVKFRTDPQWVTGAAVQVAASGGGLQQNNIYYVESLGNGRYAFHNSSAAAINGSQSTRLTTRVPLSSPLTQEFFGVSVDPVGSPQQPASTVASAGAWQQYATVEVGSRLYVVNGLSITAPASQDTYFGSKTFSFQSDPGVSTGTRFTVNQSVQVYRNINYYTSQASDYNYDPVTVMQPGVDYYIRSEGNGQYGVFDSLSNAANLNSDVGRIYVSGSPDVASRSLGLGFTVGMFNPQSLGIGTFDGDGIKFPDVVTLTNNSNWKDGQQVRLANDAGGLTANTPYYLRRVGSGTFAFFNSQENAVATGNPRPMTGVMSLSAGITSANVTAFNRLAYNFDEAGFTSLTALLNTLISNKVRDGDLDQAKLQTLTAQLQNNTEAMTALIKAFTDMNAQLARAL